MTPCHHLGISIALDSFEIFISIIIIVKSNIREFELYKFIFDLHLYFQ